MNYWTLVFLAIYFNSISEFNKNWAINSIVLMSMLCLLRSQWLQHLLHSLSKLENFYRMEFYKLIHQDKRKTQRIIKQIMFSFETTLLLKEEKQYSRLFKKKTNIIVSPLGSFPSLDTKLNFRLQLWRDLGILFLNDRFLKYHAFHNKYTYLLFFVTPKIQIFDSFNKTDYAEYSQIVELFFFVSN